MVPVRIVHADHMKLKVGCEATKDSSRPRRVPVRRDYIHLVSATIPQIADDVSRLLNGAVRRPCHDDKQTGRIPVPDRKVRSQS